MVSWLLFIFYTNFYLCIYIHQGHPAEINEIFDAISYSKGSSVIRMLHDYIGDDAFRKGLHNYLTEYSYKNTVTENLWSHLAKASNKPVNEVMSSWTLQMVCLSSRFKIKRIFFNTSGNILKNEG